MGIAEKNLCTKLKNEKAKAPEDESGAWMCSNSYLKITSGDMSHKPLPH
jgi:hypothetical protein